jgi:oligoribonuclease (3'-5' exoribonuclease)
MTGLNAETEQILSIACFITDYDLNLLDNNGFEAVIGQPQHVLDGMDPWCVRTHGMSGLTAACLASTTTALRASIDLLEYVKHHVPEPGKALLAGNSVHVDKMFLMQPPWKTILNHLHYRILDVSAIKEGVRRWCGEEVVQGIPSKASKHEAKADVLESIEEAKYYRSLFKKMKAEP